MLGEDRRLLRAQLDEALHESALRQFALEDEGLRFSSLETEKLRLETAFAKAASRSAKALARLVEVEASILGIQSAAVEAFRAFEELAVELEEYFDMGYALCEELVKLKYPSIDLDSLAEEVSETPAPAAKVPAPVQPRARDLP